MYANRNCLKTCHCSILGIPVTAGHVPRIVEMQKDRLEKPSDLLKQRVYVWKKETKVYSIFIVYSTFINTKLIHCVLMLSLEDL